MSLDTPDLIAELKCLSSAEEFFAALEVDYDPARLGIARLHILKRMGDVLGSTDFAGLDDETIHATCRKALSDAYAEFTTKPPVEARLFKVLKDRDPKKPQGAFVSFESLFG